jgi:hypothetical protein
VVNEARCGRCSAELAGGDELADVGGSEHHLTNRAGLRFHVRRYRRAPGCTASGPATDEDTWFAGHTWQRAYCRSCGVHAGWLFRSKASVFWALLI